MPEKYQWFNGLKFTRDDKTGYYLNSTIRERMHRYVWKFHHGEIPEGYQIHHIDHNRGNNDISNLQMISNHLHASMHGIEQNELHPDEMKARMDYARIYASKWHGSVKGKGWHKRHYQEMKESLYVKKAFVCEYCGKKFTAIEQGKNRFCSNKCKSAWRRKSGVDDEIRICCFCGRPFETNKYEKTKCCSRSCANRTRKIHKNKENTTDRI